MRHDLFTRSDCYALYDTSMDVYKLSWTARKSCGQGLGGEGPPSGMRRDNPEALLYMTVSCAGRAVVLLPLLYR